MYTDVQNITPFWQIFNSILNIAAVIWLVRVETQLSRINIILKLKLGVNGS